MGMIIQSLSVVVPSKKCINDCKFCVAKTRQDNYKNQLNSNLRFYDLYLKDYLKRLEFARDNGCNTVMLTGDAEPQQNRKFLETFGILNSQLDKPFRWIEMQTTGTLINDGYLRFLRNHVGVSTISVSLSSFDDDTNNNICGIKNRVILQELCHEIKRYDFNLRLSINLTDEFDLISPNDIFEYCRNTLDADQITFRVLFQSLNNSQQDHWIKEHSAKQSTIDHIKEYIELHGSKLEHLEYGACKYSVLGMSTVLDDDCMAKRNDKDEYKYLILRPDCKLYSKWDDPASLIF